MNLFFFSALKILPYLVIAQTCTQIIWLQVHQALNEPLVTYMAKEIPLLQKFHDIHFLQGSHHYLEDWLLPTSFMK